MPSSSENKFKQQLVSLRGHTCELVWFKLDKAYQSGISPKVVALFSATNFSSNIIELLQLHDTIQI